jgi:hypothetical protein
MLLPLPKVEVRGQRAVAKVGTVVQGDGVSSGSPTNMGCSSFVGFSLHLEPVATLAIIILHDSSRQGLSHMG